MMNESDFMWLLINGRIERLKGRLYDAVKKFYGKFDNTKSTDRIYLINLISDLNDACDYMENKIK